MKYFTNIMLSARKNFTSLRAKLIFAFLIPIIFIVFLGIVSFNKAAEGIRSSYENSTEQTIKMTSKYLHLGIETLQAVSTQYVGEEQKQKYIAGYYTDDIVKNTSIYNSLKSELVRKEKTDDIISLISIITDKTKVVSSKEIVGENICAGFYETDVGKEINSNRSKTFWLGQNNIWMINWELVQENMHFDL